MSLRLRLLAVLPLLFFAGQLFHHWQQQAIANIFWMCNVSNLTLAIGLLTGWRLAVQISALWLLLGLPLWLIDLFQFHQLPVTTFAAHLGGNVIAAIVLSRIGYQRGVWYWAWLWFFAVRLYCRWFTLSSLNVNLAFSTRGAPGWPLTVFWVYWLATMALAAIILFGIERFFLSRFSIRANNQRTLFKPDIATK